MSEDSERKRIGWIHWERRTEGKVPVYEGDLDDFDPTEEDPNFEEMEPIVDGRSQEPLDSELNLRWEHTDV